MALDESSDDVSDRGSVAIVGRDAGRAVVWLRGEHDLATVGALSETMALAIAIDDSDLVVDLSDARFIDAATLGVLVRAHEFLRLRSRSLTLRRPSAIVLIVIDVCGLTDLLDPVPVEATPMTGAAGALGTWVAVPATDRVDRRAGESSPKPGRTEEPSRGGGGAGRGTLVLEGEFDLERVGDLRRKLMAAIKGAHDTVLVDLSQVSSIGASCIAALLYANRVAPIHGREMILIAPSPICREALEALGVWALFNLREPLPVEADQEIRR